VVPVPVTGGILFRSVTAGADHACGVDVDGVAYCWGGNDAGQLGTRDTAPSRRPVPVAGQLRFRLLSAGDSHTCGLTVDSLAYCWGSNRRGQLGVGTRGARRGPQRVAFGRRWLMLSAGALHTCGVTAGHHPSVFCWGDNFHEQINGRRSPVNMGDPILWAPTFAVEPLELLEVSAGRWHTCVTRRQDSFAVSCWGTNIDDQLGRNVWGPYVHVSAGDAHTCAVRRDGAIYCWGRNAAGQLGNGTAFNEQRPVRIVEPVALQP
jgi:alpha-tubulin suppressor-like RCC1 family protein